MSLLWLCLAANLKSKLEETCGDNPQAYRKGERETGGTKKKTAQAAGKEIFCERLEALKMITINTAIILVMGSVTAGIIIGMAIERWMEK